MAQVDIAVWRLLLNTSPSESGLFPNQLDTTCPGRMVPIDGVTDEGGL